MFSITQLLQCFLSMVVFGFMVSLAIALTIATVLLKKWLQSIDE